MLRKAQTEIALIVGLLVIAVVVVVFSSYSLTQFPVQPASIGEDQKGVVVYIRDALSKATEETLIKLYTQGGYISTDGVRTVEFLWNDVPYWQLCDQAIMPPPIIESLQVDVENTLRENIPGSMSIAGRQVVMDTGNLNVVAEVFEGKLVVSLELTATVDGVPLPQPYVIEIDTDMGRIIKFAEDFAKTQKDYRMLDNNMIKIIRRSNPYDGCWLPISGSVPGGGFRKSWTSLRNCMEDVIYHVLTHTYEWQRPVLLDHCPPGTASCISDDMLKYAFIPQIKKYTGNSEWGQYVDLELEFEFATQGRKLSRVNPEMIFNTDPDPVKFKSLSIPIIPPITSYEVTYDVSFPVVVRVWDDSLDTYFHFAVFVNIDDMEVSDVCNLDDVNDDPYTRLCVDEAVHPAKITVMDPEGNGLPSVHVSLGICELGTTGDGGILERNVHDVDNAVLDMYYPFANSWHSECVDTGDLSDKVVHMPIPKSFDTHFYIIEIEETIDLSGESVLRVDRVGRTLQSNMDANIDVLITMPGNDCTEDVEYSCNNHLTITDMGNPINGIFTDGSMELPATAIYSPNVTLSMSESAGVWSIVTDDVLIDYTKDDIYIFAPIVLGGGHVDDYQIEELYSECLIDPMSHEEPSDWVGCTSLIDVV